MKQVLVTGGAHRLGAEIVRQFAAAGWRVWCHYQRSGAAAQALQTELQNQGSCVELVQADLAQSAQVERMVDHITRTTGPLDCLVNNASLFEPDEGTDMDLPGARLQLEVNLIAPMALASWMAKQAAPNAAPGQRSVIHILDQKVFNLNPDYFSYTVSKLALERAVALQAQALAPGLRCVAWPRA
jgi:NAD(P)-dependent dehydrogenase (short-subunit alcohol dehydrogenase family)